LKRINIDEVKEKKRRRRRRRRRREEKKKRLKVFFLFIIPSTKVVFCISIYKNDTRNKRRKRNSVNA